VAGLSVTDAAPSVVRDVVTATGTGAGTGDSTIAGGGGAFTTKPGGVRSGVTGSETTGSGVPSKSPASFPTNTA